MKRPWEVSRRAALRGLGVGIGLPLLQAMLPGMKRAHAAGNTPKRLVFFVFEGGTSESPYPNRGRPGAFWPQTLGTGFETTPILRPLIDAGLKNDILLVANLHNEIARQGTTPEFRGLDHNRAPIALLTGVNPSYADGPVTTAGISVDQYAARSLNTPVPSLYLCNPFHSTYIRQQLSWSNPRTRVAPIVKPSLAFREVFGDRTADPVAARRNLAYSRSMLNAAKADIDRLNRKLGTEDKAVLDEYLTGISALERRLAATGSCSGGNPPRDPPVDRPNYYEYAIDLPAHNRLMSDIIANAFVCDTTRVAVMHLRTHRLNPASIFGGNTTTPYSIWHNDIEHAEEGGQFGADRGDPAGIARRYDLYTAGCQAMIAQFAYLVRKLKDTPERDGNGSILDNTILVCTSEISYGSGHSTTKLPVIIAGRGGGAVRPGRFVSVPRQPIANLWVSMLRAAGVRTSSGGEVTSFGNSTESLALG